MLESCTFILTRRLLYGGWITSYRSGGMPIAQLVCFCQKFFN